MVKILCLAVFIIINMFSQTIPTPEKEHNKNFKLKNYGGK